MFLDEGRLPNGQGCEKNRARVANWRRRNAEVDKAARKVRRAANRERENANHRRWRAANRPKTRNGELKRKYGITLAQWNAIFLDQGKKCAISACGVTEAKWATDHDHKTGKFRGIVCPGCNVLLGLAKDNPAMLAAAIEYLKGSS